MPPLGTIVVVNGASSSGKTSVVRAVQDASEEVYLDAGLDRFLFSLPRRYRERPLWDDVLGRNVRAGATGHQLMRGMHEAIAALSRSGSNVLADHVLVEPSWVRQCADLFRDLPAYLVGLHCPLDELERRERDRRDRTLGQAREMFGVVHAHGSYDLEVDTATLTPEACAAAILAHVATQEPRAWRELASRG